MKRNRQILVTNTLILLIVIVVGALLAVQTGKLILNWFQYISLVPNASFKMPTNNNNYHAQQQRQTYFACFV
jgi:hypothetical protein